MAHTFLAWEFLEMTQCLSQREQTFAFGELQAFGEDSS